jgi:hypothetical protein
MEMVVNLNSEKNISMFDEKPCPLQMVELPIFPLHVLPDVLSGHCLDIMSNLEVGPDMVASGMLGLLGAINQGRYLISPKPGWKVNVNVYMAIVAAPGEKKSLVLKSIRKPVDDAVDLVNSENSKALCENENNRKNLQLRINGIESTISGNALTDEKYKSMESLLNKLRDDLKNIPVKHELRLFAEDCTIEKMADLLASNDEKMCDISDEGVFFSILLGRYSKDINIDLPLKAYSRETSYVDRISRPSLKLTQPLMSILQYSQPVKIMEFFACKIMKERGITSRFLYVTNASLDGDPNLYTPDVDLKRQQEYSSLIYTLVKRSTEKVQTVLTLTDAARALFASFIIYAKRMGKGELAPMVDWATRIPEHCLRMAALLHIAKNDGTEVLNEKTMSEAIELVDYFTVHAKYVYGLTTNKDEYIKAVYMLDKIKEKGILAMGFGEAKKVFSKFRHDNEGFEQAVNILCEHGYAKKIEPRSGAVGRKAQFEYIFHPDILKGGYTIISEI